MSAPTRARIHTGLLLIAVLAFSSALSAQAFAERPSPPPSVPASQIQPGEPGFVPLTSTQRANLFVRGYLGHPNTYVRSVASAGVALAFNKPEAWHRTWGGYGKRLGTGLAFSATREAVHDAGDAALGLDPRYFSCRCTGALQRSAHALKMTVFAYNADGRPRLDLPRFAADYGASMLVTTWYPSHYSPLTQGVRMGHVQVSLDAGLNLLREFAPELRRAFRRPR